MKRNRVSLRAGVAASLLALPLLTAAASGTGYLVEIRSQQADRNQALAAAASFVRDGAAMADSRQWQQTLTKRLAALQLTAELTIASRTSKRSIYQPQPTAGEPKPKASSSEAGTLNLNHPTATYTFPLAKAADQRLRLNLFAPPFDRSRRLFVALLSGLAVLLAGVTLLIWATGRWLVGPLRRLNTQVDAIAGGELIGPRLGSPIREVDNVAAAVSGMANGLAEASEQEARLEAERRLLFGAIAHDVRTPLFALRGYLDAIASGIGDPSQRLEQAREKARQIDRLIAGLFNYTRAQLDERPELQTTDLDRAVADATASFELVADEHQVELRVNAHAGTTVRINSDAFDRALANVIDNALRHTPRGGTIDVTAGEDTDGAYIRVLDDGPGIAPDLLARVFEPLLRADDTGDGRAGRAGLGLSIAAQLIHNQGGTIHAENTTGRGAAITLRLPTVTAAEPTSSLQK